MMAFARHSADTRLRVFSCMWHTGCASTPADTPRNTLLGQIWASAADLHICLQIFLFNYRFSFARLLGGVCGAVLCCSVVWCGKASHFLVAVACLRCFICRRFSTGTVGREIAPTNSKRQTPNACHRLMNIHKYARAETSSCPSEIVPREIKSNCYSTLRLLAASVGGELYANICPGRKN